MQLVDVPGDEVEVERHVDSHHPAALNRGGVGVDAQPE
jgi:hypothetical protein